ncbi:MAG: DNA alkylation repair protein, partial [Acidimicrobiia bacterium]|nr:DNA alkylation repair protein [Acidimicrobiia bacterium]
MTQPVATFVTAELTAASDPDRAGPMAAYMKTDMAFFGVQAGPRKAIVRAAARRFPPADATEYRDQ